MKNYSQTASDDEIDIRALFLKLWRNKAYIIVFATISVFFGSMHLHNVEKKYFVEYNLKPVGESQQKDNSFGLSGLASLARIELPSNNSSDFMIFKELLTSVEVAEIILTNTKLIKNIYSSEWDTSLKSYSEPSKSKIREHFDLLKRSLTGSKEMKYMPPNARRLAIYISKNISISQNKDTSFLKISAETSKPEMLSSLISEAIEISDQIMRQRYINFSKEPLAFYKEKIRTARSREHREALAGLISTEEQKLMLASQGKYFTAEPYILPTISLYPTSPKPQLVLLLSIILGSMFGCVIILLRNATWKDN